MDERDTAHDVARELAANAADVDERGVFPVANLEALKRSRLMGLMVPAPYGGLGGDCRTLVDVARILAASCLSTGMVWAMHCQQVATLADHGSERLRDDVLPRIAEEGSFIASVTSEKGKGAHLLTANAPLLREGGEVLLEREAPVCTGGAHADSYLVTMRSHPEAAPSDVVLVYARRAQLDVKVRSGWPSLGMRGTDSVALTLRGRLPNHQLIDPQGGFEHVATSTMIPVGHIAWAAAWLGAAQGALSRMLAVWRNPSSRRGVDLTSDLFATRLARIRLQVDAAEAYLDQAVAEYEAWRAQPAAEPARVPTRLNIHLGNLKILASELLFDAVDQLVQLAGLSHGYLRNDGVPLERTFRDLRSASMMYSNERLLIANGKLTLVDNDLLARPSVPAPVPAIS